MKTLIVFALLSVLCEAFVEHEVILRRAKRQAMTYSDLRTLQCVRGCILEFKETMENMKQLQSKSAFIMNDALLNKKRLDKFCQSYNELDSCIAECDPESSPVAQNIVKMFESFDIICKTRYEEFVSYLPCYAKSKRPTKERCTEACGDPETFQTDVQEKMKNQMIQSDSEGLINAVNAMLKTTCDYASCVQRCQSRVIIETCPGEQGQDAAEFMVMFSSQAIKSVSRGLKAVVPQMVIPEDCLTREEPSAAVNRPERITDANEDDDE